MSEQPDQPPSTDTAPTNGTNHQSMQVEAVAARIAAIGADCESKQALLGAALTDVERTKAALAEAVQQAIDARDSATANGQAAATLLAEMQERKRLAEEEEEAAASAIKAVRSETETLKAEILAQRDLIKEIVNQGNLHLDALESEATKHQEAAGEAEADAAKAADAKAAILAIQENLRGAEERANAAAASIEAVKVGVTQMQEVVATKSDHIEGGRKHVDQVRSQLDRALTAANQSATQAESQHQSARTVATNLDALAATAMVAKANIDSNAEAAAAARKAVDEHAKRVVELAETADELEKRIAASEEHLGQLEAAAVERLKTIDDLLPGATSAGLASAFHKRSEGFKRPEKVWQGVFLGALGILLALAILETTRVGVDPTTPAWDALLRMVLHRLPFILPLVWLAVYASRQASIAKRMEEEYAFKATIATSFEGFRRKMAEVGTKHGMGYLVAQLCGDTMRIIAAPPSRVYDGTRMDPTPGTLAAETIPPVADGVAKVAEAAKPGV